MSRSETWIESRGPGDGSWDWCFRHIHTRGQNVLGHSMRQSDSASSSHANTYAFTDTRNSAVSRNAPPGRIMSPAAQLTEAEPVDSYQERARLSRKRRCAKAIALSKDSPRTRFCKSFGPQLRKPSNVRTNSCWIDFWQPRASLPTLLAHFPVGFRNWPQK